jgi:hypothetical protein
MDPVTKLLDQMHELLDNAEVDISLGTEEKIARELQAMLADTANDLEEQAAEYGYTVDHRFAEGVRFVADLLADHGLDYCRTDD